MNNRELLKGLENATIEAEKKLVGRIATGAEIKEELINELKHLKGIYIPNVVFGDIEEASDGLRVVIDNELYPDIVLGYENAEENDNCIMTCEVKFIDLDFCDEEE